MAHACQNSYILWPSDHHQWIFTQQDHDSQPSYRMENYFWRLLCCAALNLKYVTHLKCDHVQEILHGATAGGLAVTLFSCPGSSVGTSLVDNRQAKMTATLEFEKTNIN